MLAHPVSDRPIDYDNGPVFIQPKLDGVRCLIQADRKGDIVTAYSRTGKEWKNIDHILFNFQINSLGGYNYVSSYISSDSIGADGNFEINNVPGGEYEIMATFIGYENFKTNITVSSNSADTFQNMNIQLSVSAIQLQEYVVTASRGKREKITDAPAAISVISELKIRSESNPNLGDYFKNIKGVDFTASGMDSYNLSARGFNSSFSSRLLTLTDGRMANVPSLRLIAYNTIPVTSDDVSQIEVVLGPSSALYGPNAHSGVVNIIT